GVGLEDRAAALEAAEDGLGQEVVAAGGDPRRAVVAAALVDGDRHVIRLGRERLVDDADVDLVLVVGVDAGGRHVGPPAGVVEEGEDRVVELQVATAQLVQPGDLGGGDRGDVGAELRVVGGGAPGRVHPAGHQDGGGGGGLRGGGGDRVS